MLPLSFKLLSYFQEFLSRTTYCRGKEELAVGVAKTRRDFRGYALTLQIFVSVKLKLIWVYNIKVSSQSDISKLISYNTGATWTLWSVLMMIKIITAKYTSKWSQSRYFQVPEWVSCSSSEILPPLDIFSLRYSVFFKIEIWWWLSHYPIYTNNPNYFCTPLYPNCIFAPHCIPIHFCTSL